MRLRSRVELETEIRALCRIESMRAEENLELCKEIDKLNADLAALREEFHEATQKTAQRLLERSGAIHTLREQLGSIADAFECKDRPLYSNIPEMILELRREHTLQRRQIAALREENERLSDLLRRAYCVYCGFETEPHPSQDGAAETLKAHVANCEKHPAFTLREKLGVAVGLIRRINNHPNTDPLWVAETNAALARIEED